MHLKRKKLQIFFFKKKPPDCMFFITAKACHKLNSYKLSFISYSILFTVLVFQIKLVDWFIEQLPIIPMRELDVKRLKNFIRMFLALDPDNRPSADEARKHKYLCSGSNLPKPDPIWKKKSKLRILFFLFLSF